MAIDPEFDAIDRTIQENLAKQAKALRLRATTTPDDVKAALQAVGHALPDERIRAHYTVLREYIGFLQATCAANLPPEES